MDRLQHIYESISKEGFADITLQEINNYVKEQNGTEDFDLKITPYVELSPDKQK